MMTEIPFFIKLAFKTERKNPCKCAEEREHLKAELLGWVNDVWK
jgi:hypothetical protein